jgi:hypothetical protein
MSTPARPHRRGCSVPLGGKAAPGRIATEIAVPAPHPRDRDGLDSAQVAAAVRHALHEVHAL